MELYPGVRLAAIVGVAAVVMAGCGPTEPSPVPFTPEALASSSSESADRADVAREAFLAFMADPEITFRVDSELRVGEENAEGVSAFQLLGRHDATATDYGGQAQLAGHLFESMTNFWLLSIDATSHVFGQGVSGWAELVSPDDAYRPNAVVGLAADDLRFVGETPDGLLEFDVVPWIFGDAIGATAELGLVDEPDLPETSTTSHRTRLFLDEIGVPQQITSEWTFESDGAADAAEGSLVQRFSSFGLYVSIRAPHPDGGPIETSHELLDDLDGNGEVETEPWFDVVPAEDADVAELEVVFAEPEEPFMLGIEGAILFVRAHDQRDDLILDQIVPFEGGSVRVPVGEQTVVAYYRSCDGSCALLDPARTFCTAAADFESGMRYRIVVQTDVTDAECTVVADS